MLYSWVRRWVAKLRLWREPDPDVSQSDWAELRAALQEARSVIQPPNSHRQR